MKSANVDYVSAWYYKAADYMKGKPIEAAFVSTNSITQGEQVPAIWKALQEEKGIVINFAYTTFIWDSEANQKAHVHCVIIGFSQKERSSRRLYYPTKGAVECSNINAYLVDGPNIFIEKRKKPICGTAEMSKGSQPTDGGNLLMNEDEKDELLRKYPGAKEFIKPFVGSEEFINNKKRYCIWLKSIDVSKYRNISPIMERIKNVKEMRLNSTKAATKKWAEAPTLFTEDRQPDSDYLLIPRVSSERRRYIPIGYMSKEYVCSDANFTLPNATPYIFGVLASNVHNSWMRAVCGRLEMRYRYSNTIVYNNFPWPTPTEEQKKKIEETAQGILDARALYPESSLADLYDPLTMPIELQKAHQQNDKAVMRAYGFDIKSTTEADCVAKLMQMYKDLTEKVQ